MEGANRRPRRRRRRSAERLKSLLIAVLALSALYLCARTGLYGDLAGVWGGLLLPEQESPIPLGSAGDSRPELIPVRITVRSGPSGRFAAQYDQALTDEVYAALRGLLAEALASARPPRQMTEAHWRQALGREGVCFDFGGQAPLDALCVWLGEGSRNDALTGDVRRLLVVRDNVGDGALLCFRDETDGTYYACETALTYRGRMAESLEPYEGSGPAFVFELEDSGGAYQALDPYVLLSATPLSPRIYEAGNPLLEAEALDRVQRALSFRPQSDAGYQVQGGLRYREGKETLEVLDRGVIAYHASEPSASRYSLGEGPSPGRTACIEAAWRLAEATLGNLSGAGRLCLLEARETASGAVVRLGYTLDGAAVALPNGAAAAQVVIQEGYITGYTLQFRRYEDTGERSLVLRELQAAAALEVQAPGGELALCYIDSGGMSLEAGWVAG